MAFQWDQRSRLLREEEWDANGLAQEIYAMMSPDAPASTQGPVEIVKNDTPNIPMTLRGFSDADTILNVTRGSDSFTFGDIGSITTGGVNIGGVNVGGNEYLNQTVDGSTVLNFPPWTNQDIMTPVGQPVPPFTLGNFSVTLGDMKFAFDLLKKLKELGLVSGDKPAQFDVNAFRRNFAGTGGGIPAQVGSVVSGSVYNVTIYPNGIGAEIPGQDVTATQLQIHADEEIPSGTWTIVTKIGSTYYMQVPVWM